MYSELLRLTEETKLVKKKIVELQSELGDHSDWIDQILTIEQKIFIGSLRVARNTEKGYRETSV